MTNRSVTERVKTIVEALIEDLEYDLVDVEFKKEGPNRFLRVFLDKEGGISLDDCQEMSKAIGEELDKEDPINGPYYLEVSSPGLDRPLKSDKDLKRNLNKEVEVSLYQAIDGQKLITGYLVDFDEEKLNIQFEDESTMEIPRDKTALIRLAIKF